jgi:hypothetical protein
LCLRSWGHKRPSPRWPSSRTSFLASSWRWALGRYSVYLCYWYKITCVTGTKVRILTLSGFGKLALLAAPLRAYDSANWLAYQESTLTEELVVLVGAANCSWKSVDQIDWKCLDSRIRRAVPVSKSLAGTYLLYWYESTCFLVQSTNADRNRWQC